MPPIGSNGRSKTYQIFHTVILGAVMCITIVLTFQFLHVSPHLARGPTLKDHDVQHLEEMIRLVHTQNKTIGSLLKSLEAHKKYTRSESLQVKPSVEVGQRNSRSDIRASSKEANLIIEPHNSLENMCESKFGMEMVHDWASKGEDWCSGGEGGASIRCYPYKQSHKGTQDLFCEAKNLLVDFSKVKGDPQKRKIRNGDNYHSFSQGALQSTCKKTPRYKEGLFMNHQRGMFRSLLAAQRPPNAGTYTTIDTTTYLLQRDEDCENAFHATADFMNMYLVMTALGIHPRDQQLMLFDRHIDGPYLELFQKAFSPEHPVLRAGAYRSKRVLFKRLVFHLESPAALIFPKVAGKAPLQCHSTSLFQNYRKFVLDAFGLYDVKPPPIPHVVLTLRRRTPAKNVGRIMANEKEVIEKLEKGNMMKLSVIDQAKMSFSEQLRMIRSANVLTGVHGAGLMFIMYAAEEAVLVEVHPSYRQDRHFRHAARMTGKAYMPVRATQRESCQGSSDNVVVPLNDFALAMDGAMRLARGFDDGISECGLKCASSILAIDSRLDLFYNKQKGEEKGAPMNLRFPC